MSAPDQTTPPDFDEDFLQAIEKWKEQHKIKDDDTILVAHGFVSDSSKPLG